MTLAPHIANEGDYQPSNGQPDSHASSCIAGGVCSSPSNLGSRHGQFLQKHACFAAVCRSRTPLHIPHLPFRLPCPRLDFAFRRHSRLCDIGQPVAHVSRVFGQSLTSLVGSRVMLRVSPDFENRTHLGASHDDLSDYHSLDRLIQATNFTWFWHVFALIGISDIWYARDMQFWEDTEIRHTQ